MKLSGKKMLIIILALMLISAYWFYLVQPKREEIEQLNNDVQTMTDQLDILTQEYTKKAAYSDAIESKNRYIKKMNNYYPGFISQEMMINTMIKIEAAIESLEISAYTMSEPVLVATSDDNEQTSDGKMKLSEDTEALIFRQSQLKVDITYEDMKKLLAYIKNSDYKLSINFMNMSSNLEESLISVAFGLDYYAIQTPDRPFEPIDYFGPYKPKEDSIFAPYEEYGVDFESGNGETAISDETDITVLLSPFISGRSTAIIFENNDKTSESYLYSDTANIESIEIVFEQMGEIYTYKYKTSSSSYPQDYIGMPFDPEDQIEISVLSSFRVDDTDNSGAETTIINNTDLPVVVKVSMDDDTKPRFEMVNMVGDVVVQ